MAKQRRAPRLGTGKKTKLDIWRANDASSGITGKRRVVKNGVVKWVPIKKK